MIKNLFRRRSSEKTVGNFSEQLAIYGTNLKSNYLEYFVGWVESNFKSPSPLHIKWTVLDRWKSGLHWVETGTLWGETTEYLALQGFQVITIEPSKDLAELAKKKFANSKNITVLNDLSENCLDAAIISHKQSEAEGISFWLDGHYSGEGTHQGPVDTPILDELNVISRHLKDFKLISVFVDDIRLFNELNKKHHDYPKIDKLVEWANTNSLSWTIEMDIFIATNNREAISDYVNN